MNLDFFTPVHGELFEELSGSGHRLVDHMKIHTPGQVPSLNGVKIALFGVLEDRLDLEGEREPFDFNGIRRQLYGLYPGNWDISIADLGDIQRGESVEDTYFAVQETMSHLLKLKIIPVILGGGQDLVYAQYRAYDFLDQMVNLVNVDSRFDLGDVEASMDNKSYVGKIVVNKPYNLFNYSAIGYQTYFNSQSEIELMEKLYFDTYRLGEVTADISRVEPVMRDADLVTMDIGAASSSALGNFRHASPNGLDGKELCALARYAGISDKVSSFGICEFSAALNFASCNMLIAQMLWYFAEGVNYRRNENTPEAKSSFTKYQVPIDSEILIFYKSPLSGRWWIEIPFESNVNNKLAVHTLLPCTQDDYLDACNQKMPERWYRAKRKNQV